MIIVGYQGIGKSTTAKNNNRFIDLESGNFWVDDRRSDDWYKTYVNIAMHISDQKHYVFMSSHKVVRDELVKRVAARATSDDNKITLTLTYPSLDLKDKWIDRLFQRFIISKLDKDYKAYINAKEMYEANIIDMMNERMFHHIVIDKIPYSLDNLISNYRGE